MNRPSSSIRTTAIALAALAAGAFVMLGVLQAVNRDLFAGSLRPVRDGVARTVTAAALPEESPIEDPSALAVTEPSAVPAAALTRPARSTAAPTAAPAAPAPAPSPAPSPAPAPEPTPVPVPVPVPGVTTPPPPDSPVGDDEGDGDDGSGNDSTLLDLLQLSEGTTLTTLLTN